MALETVDLPKTAATAITAPDGAPVRAGGHDGVEAGTSDNRAGAAFTSPAEQDAASLTIASLLPPEIVDAVLNYHKRRGERDQAPPFTAVNTFADAAVIDQKLNELEGDLQARYERYLGEFQAATDPTMRAYYRDLYIAMMTDLNDIAAARSLPHSWDRADVYNRVAHEAFIEVRFNVILWNDGGGGKPWSPQDLRDIEKGFESLPYAHTVESDSLWMVMKRKELAGPSGAHAAEFDASTGIISVTDSASSDSGSPSTQYAMVEAIVHEMGHSHHPAPEVMTEFMAVSGWRHLGERRDARLADLSTGDWVQAHSLRERGFSIEGDDQQWFQVSKSDHGLYVVPSEAPPTRSPNLVSDYALSNPVEDFAETYKFYYLHRDEMRTSHPAKFDFMERHFGPVQP